MVEESVQIIHSRGNAFLQHIRKLGSSASYRKETGEFLGDGWKLIETGLAVNFPFSAIILSEKQSHLWEKVPSTVKKIQVSSQMMESISPMKTPQGALFLGNIPESKVKSPQLDSLAQGQYLLLDGVQDPGNVGTIWRTAQGLGISTLILLGDCASPWNPKTIRSSMGACFCVPVIGLSQEEGVALCNNSKIPLYATCLEPESVALDTVNLANSAVVLGSEGKGISPSLLAQCEKKIYLPMEQDCESLNVGIVAGIVAWEMKKSRNVPKE